MSTFRSLSAVFAGAAAALSLLPSNALAASASAVAKQVVQSGIAISQKTDLDFGTASPGDGSKTVAPSATSASFTVSGVAALNYNIVLPADGAVVMKLTGGGATADEKIAVTGFASLPSASGTIGAGGTQVLEVGATRAALTPTQAIGTYTGSFSVAVVYQ